MEKLTPQLDPEDILNKECPNDEVPLTRAQSCGFCALMLAGCIVWLCLVGGLIYWIYCKF